MFSFFVMGMVQVYLIVQFGCFEHVVEASGVAPVE